MENGLSRYIQLVKVLCQKDRALAGLQGWKYQFQFHVSGPELANRTLKLKSLNVTFRTA
jgi:hypothetical protein